MAVGQEYLRPKLPAKLGWLNIRATYFFRAKLQVTIHLWRSLCWIVPQLISVLNNRDLYQLCPWSHIQLIVYLDNIISIALIPVLKYWWRRANNTAASQVVIKGVLLHFSNTSSVIRNNVHHYEIPQCISNEDTTVMQWKEVSKGKYIWGPTPSNLICHFCHRKFGDIMILLHQLVHVSASNPRWLARIAFEILIPVPVGTFYTCTHRPPTYVAEEVFNVINVTGKYSFLL